MPILMLTEYETKFSSRSPILHSMFFAALSLLAFPTVGQDVNVAIESAVTQRPGPNIMDTVVDMQANSEGPCILQSDGTLFCWATYITGRSGESVSSVDYPYLNDALDNDIAAFTTGDFLNTTCAIGKESGVACVENPRFEFEATTLASIPEPDANYIALSNLNDSNTICGIQADNRTVCWGDSEPIKSMPEEARYLKHVSIRFDQACGVDLTDSLICWGETILENDLDQQFGLEDLSTIGSIKQIELGPYGACVINTDHGLRCFGGISQYTEYFSGIALKSVDLSYTNRPAICFEDQSGRIDCISEGFISETEFGIRSILAAGLDARLVHVRGELFQVNEDNSFISYYDELDPAYITNLFPTGPVNLRREVYSNSALELFWDRADNFRDPSSIVTGYEIYSSGQLIDETDVVASYFVEGLDNAHAANYSVRPVRGAVGGTAQSDGNGNVPSGTRIGPPSNLRGEVYSSSALEIFYDRDEAPGATYEITRNGVIVSATNPGTSYFDSDLQAGTQYLYEVKTLVEGVKSGASRVTLITNSGAEDMQ